MIHRKTVEKLGFIKTWDNGLEYIYELKKDYSNLVIEFCNYNTSKFWKVREINGNRVSIDLNYLTQVKHLIKGIFNK